MKKMTSNEIRDLWIKYFKGKNHMLLDSASLVPADDDSLLFINAGVTPLKKYFDGTIVPDNKRLTSIQKCIRTNDIENVGVTKRHLTFFEMMGNFSIGDYFRHEALGFAYEFLTSEDYCAIPKEKIYVTIYIDDNESYDRWVELGLDSSHIIRLEGNYWEIGEGPCGPDSEIFFDRGEEYDPNGDALEKFKRDVDQERYVEIWNNVFSQYNSKRGVDRKDYQELPHKNIDTGAGLERWCCIFQNVDSTYDTDLFQPIIKGIEGLTGITYNGQKEFKVIADHIRTITMALSDGAMFENTGRGYVLRRLLRRSVRMGKRLGLTDCFMYKLVDEVVSVMGEFYQELKQQQGIIKTYVLQEEELFHKTLTMGEKRLYQLIETSKDDFISGYDMFKLYDTYGFPFDLAMEYLDEANKTTDKDEFNKYVNEARQLAKDNHKQVNNMSIQNKLLLDFKEESEFFYDTYEMNSKVIGLIKDGELVDYLDSDGYVILDKTCFYAESGGQVSDVGAMKSENCKIKVIDVTKAPNGQHLHRVEFVDGSIALHENVAIKIMEDIRNNTAINHSAVHILQKTLQEVLETNIHQAGSYVDSERLRFDFTYTGKIMESDIINIENRANERIRENSLVEIKEMTLEEAKKTGAMALFTEKYKDIVRVVKIGDSLELCGGTHVKNTSDIERLAIVKIESKGSNLYRIEAATNNNIEPLISEAISVYVEEIKKLMNKAKDILTKAKEEDIDLIFDVILDQEGVSSYQNVIYNKNQLEYVQIEVKNLEKKYQELKLHKLQENLSRYNEQVEVINDKKLLIVQFSNQDVSSLKALVDSLLNLINEGLVFVINKNNDSVNYICRSNISINAGDIVKMASTLSNGNGGGSPTFAQGGGKDSSKIDEVIENIKNMYKI